MRFALVDGERREARSGLRGVCIGCGSEMDPKCGEVKVHHWAHKRRQDCDHWWENETEWHRAWKRRFPDDWQEVRHRAPDGEWHIADVKTAHGWVLEFQHSPLKPEERRSREDFYRKMVWIVDGQRLENALARFLRACRFASTIFPTSSKLKVPTQSAGALMKRWVGSDVNVFFDVGDSKHLMWLAPESNDEWGYVEPFSLQRFVQLHRVTSRNESLKFDRDIRQRRHYIASIEKLPYPDPVEDPQQGPTSPSKSATTS